MYKSMQERREEIPVWEKTMLTIREAAAYTGVGVGKLREISDDESCDFVLWVGTRRMFKRKKLEEYLERTYSM